MPTDHARNLSNARMCRPISGRVSKPSSELRQAASSACGVAVRAPAVAAGSSRTGRSDRFASALQGVLAVAEEGLSALDQGGPSPDCLAGAELVARPGCVHPVTRGRLDKRDRQWLRGFVPVFAEHLGFGRRAHRSVRPLGVGCVAGRADVPGVARMETRWGIVGRMGNGVDVRSVVGHSNVDERAPEVQCVGKRGYGSKAKAKRSARRSEGKIGRVFTYRCPHCNLFHLGHRR